MKVEDLFYVSYGNSLELNNLEKSKNGINFVSRTSKNNGVSAVVKENKNLKPFEEGIITVAVGGSVMEAFVQPKPFYTGFHMMILKPKKEMSLSLPSSSSFSLMSKV